MKETTVGKLLLENIIPKDIAPTIDELSSKNIREILKRLAEKYPDRYREISAKLIQLSVKAGQESGGYPFSIKDLIADQETYALREEYKDKIRQILNNPNLSSAQRSQSLINLAKEYGSKLEVKLFENLKKANNPLSYLVRSGASGKAKPSAIKNLILGDTLFTDANDNVLPYPITHALIEGYRPHEYAAGTFGARKGMAIKKLGTQEGGWFAKKLQNAAHRLIVTDKDYKDYDPKFKIGLEVPVDDPDNEGALLADDIGGYKRNTVLTQRILHDLKNQGIKTILVRSPLLKSAPDGGVYAYDVGVNEKRTIAPIGDYVGLSAAHAIGEPLTQALLNAKHTGGDVGTSKDVSPDVIDKLVSTPQFFPQGASYSEVDGKVANIQPAPQGGYYVYVQDKEHYVYPGQNVIVKVGDEVETGDPLSDGIINPVKLVQLKGLGEARKIFAEKFRDMINKIVGQGHRRNVELLTRALFDFVSVDEPFGQYLPGDIARYSSIENTYVPREDSEIKDPEDSINEYLEKPVLHYTIGTRITPKVAKKLKQWGITGIVVNKHKPPFTPIYQWAEHVAGLDRDWMSQMLSTHLEKRLLESVAEGSIADVTGTSYVPALAEGVRFGYSGKTKGWSTLDLPQLREETKRLSGGTI